jgi:hypothetical protein
MLDFRTADDPQEPLVTAYGLGTARLRIPGVEGLEIYGHGGNGIGYVVGMLYLPRDEACVVLMTNDHGATMGTTAAAFLQAVDGGLEDGVPPLFIGFGFLEQVLLVLDFAARLWRPPLERRYGWLIYALGLPAGGLAILLAVSGAPGYQPLAFGLYAAWAGLGAWVDHVRPVAWRSPPRWRVFVPYVGLFTASQFAFWIPMWYVGLGAWLAFGALYALQTSLNLASHARHGGAAVHPGT